MVHRIYPILGGLALGLAVLALPRTATAAPSSNAPEYSGLIASGLASRDAPATSVAGNGRLRTAQGDARGEDDSGTSARKSLGQELDHLRRKAANETGATGFDPPMPVRKRHAQDEPELAEAAVQQVHQTASAANPQIDRLTGQLLLMHFRGSSPADPGPRSIRALLQSGLISGAAFGRENISSKAQLKELMKFFLAAGAQNRPLFALREVGGDSDALPPVKDFEQWPSQRDVAAKGDPQYAYSTYRSMGASLAGLGFNVNFGPVLAAPTDGQDAAASFGNNPLQAGVFAKTFILGHREEKVIAVPVVDGGNQSVRALKTLLVSDPGIPISLAADKSGIMPLSAYQGLVKGVRFCFVELTVANAGAGAVNGFKQGCDAFVIDGGTENPAAIRDRVALGLSEAVQNRDVTLDDLSSAAARLSELR